MQLMTRNSAEIQTTFDTTKYIALAYGSPAGNNLTQLVEKNWSSWVQIVDEAPWLKNWKRSPYYRNQQQKQQSGYTQPHASGTPLGHSVEGPDMQQQVARCIYVETVWQYGWLADQNTRRIYEAFWQLQKRPNSVYTVDAGIYRGTKLIVPPEVGDLDRWLEPLWRRV